MTQTLTRLFDSHREAVDAVRELEAMGVPSDNISLIGNNQERWHEERSFSPQDRGDAAEGAAEGAGTGAAIGGALGGGAGLLAGLGLLAIPGIGPVAAAGWLGATLLGAAGGAAAGGAAGGLIGALKEAGVDREDAEVFAEGLRRGGTLVAVRVDGSRLQRAREALERFRGADAAERRAMYKERGWSRFDESAEPFTRDQIERERSLFRG